MYITNQVVHTDLKLDPLPATIVYRFDLVAQSYPSQN